MSHDDMQQHDEDTEEAEFITTSSPSKDRDKIRKECLRKGITLNALSFDDEMESTPPELPIEFAYCFSTSNMQGGYCLLVKNRYPLAEASNHWLSHHGKYLPIIGNLHIRWA